MVECAGHVEFRGVRLHESEILIANGSLSCLHICDKSRVNVVLVEHVRVPQQFNVDFLSFRVVLKSGVGAIAASRDAVCLVPNENLFFIYPFPTGDAVPCVELVLSDEITAVGLACEDVFVVLRLARLTVRNRCPYSRSVPVSVTVVSRVVLETATARGPQLCKCLTVLQRRTVGV